MSMKHALLLASGGFLLSGCYNYRPLAIPQAAVGTPVAVTLNDAGTGELARLVGSGADIVEGTILKTNDSALVLGIRMVRLRNGQENYWKGEDVAIAQRQIAGLTERRLDRPRTFLAFGSVLAGAIVAGIKFSKTGGGTIPPGGGSTPPQ